MVAGAEPQQRRSPVAQMRQHQLAARAVLHGDRRAGLGIDQLGMDEAAAAEMHAVLLLAFAPQRDADVADAHRLGDLRAPAFLQPARMRRLAAAGLARDQHALDAGILRSKRRSAAHSMRCEA